MSDIVKYQQSISAEFSARKNRVRFFIGDSHWGEDGRYKEIILADFLKGMVPNNVEVGTGFVRNSNGELTRQIDILIYRKNAPCLFKNGDFVVLMPESVLAIIEVKSTASVEVLSEKGRKGEGASVIEKCEENGRIIGSASIFNGIWGYDSDITISTRENNLRRQLASSRGYLNNICFNANLFCHYWAEGNPIDRWSDPRSCYSFYDLSSRSVFGEQMEEAGLAYGYFISNLLESIYQQTKPEILTEQYFEFLYPLKYTKERYRCDGCDIKIDT